MVELWMFSKMKMVVAKANLIAAHQSSAHISDLDVQPPQIQLMGLRRSAMSFLIVVLDSLSE
jgi:hypothetical protein